MDLALTVERLELGPDSLVVVRADRAASVREVEALARVVGGAVRERGARAVVVAGDVRLEVLGDAELERLGLQRIPG